MLCGLVDLLCVSGATRGPDRAQSSAGRQELRRDIPGENKHKFTVRLTDMQEVMLAWLVAGSAAVERSGGRGGGRGGLEEAAGPSARHRSVMLSTFKSLSSQQFSLLLHLTFFFYSEWPDAQTLHGSGHACLQVSGQDWETKTRHDGGQTPGSQQF